MNKLSLICTALMILSFIFMFGIGNTEGFEIEVMKPSFGDYYDFSGYLYHSAYVKTSEPYYAVSWYLNGKYVGCSGGGEADDTEACFAFDAYAEDPPGSPFGKTYTIKAEVWSIGPIDNPSVKATKSYNVTVYSVPKTDEITSGNWTMATMYGEVDVGWNGTTAEARAKGKITNNTPHDIVYGIRIHYVVGMLQVNNDALALQLDVPDQLLIDVGVIKAHADVNDREYSYSDSYTLGNWGIPGRRYVVDAKVEITAQVPGGDPNKMDELLVPERQVLTISKDQ